MLGSVMTERVLRLASEIQQLDLLELNDLWRILWHEGDPPAGVREPRRPNPDTGRDYIRAEVFGEHREPGTPFLRPALDV